MNNRELLIMSKRKNGKLYSVDLTLQYEFKKEDCSAEILISCQIGTKQIEVQRKQFNICQFTGMYVLTCLFTCLKWIPLTLTEYVLNH